MPVIERSVTIAGISTRELVTKDYALEVNEEKMRKAAQLMTQNLDGNLAMVTCKEPLRSNMASHLRLILSEQGFADVSEHNHSPCPKSTHHCFSLFRKSVSNSSSTIMWISLAL